MSRVIPVFLVGLILGLGAPAFADHVVEPTAPILDTDLRLYDYGTMNRAVCNGSYDFDRVYFDLFVVVADLPSVHWDLRYTHQEAEAVNPAKARWIVVPHSNAAPHNHNDSLRWRGAWGDIPAPASGPLSWLFEVTNTETGEVFTESCTIWRG